MLKVENVTKSYATPRGGLSILNGISLSLTRGDAIAIMGPSGSGKSTLLYILGALDPPAKRSSVRLGAISWTVALLALAGAAMGFVLLRRNRE